MTAQSPFNRIVYFGDSLTDSGTVFDLSSEVLAIPIPPAELGYAGQFSNGDVYADIAPALLGAAVENFGVGGARAIGEIPFGGFFQSLEGAPADFNPFIAPLTDDIINFDINLGGQIDRFLASEAARGTGPIAGTAASILIGLNDLNNFAPTSADPDIVVQQALGLSGEILFETLAASFDLAFAGVETIVLNTLLPASFFPSAVFAPPEVIALGDSIIPLYNFNLGVAATVLQGSGIDARIVDFNAIGNELLDDPTAFGFVADFSESIFLGFGSNPAIVPDGAGGFAPFFPSNTTAVDVDPDQIAFIDLLHPTTATHGILGAFQAQSLTNNVVFGEEGANDNLLLTIGDDLVFGSDGNDVLRVARGDDIAFGGQGDDVLQGFVGDDILNGGSGDDIVSGGAGEDVVAGAQGDDRVLGGDGNDVLIGGLGSDLLVGQADDDTFLYTEASLLGGTTGADTDSILGGFGDDTIVLALTDETRALVEAELTGSPRQTLNSIGVELFSVENVVFVDSRLDFADLDLNRLDEADLWGLI